MRMITTRLLSLAFVATGAWTLLVGCNPAPRDSFVQWVARDAWDSTCAEHAIVETFTETNRRWKIKGEVYVIDVDARFKLVNACKSGLPLIGKDYQQFEVVPFKATVEMSRCKKGDADGWSLPGKEGSRCWTGPTLLK